MDKSFQADPKIKAARKQTLDGIIATLYTVDFTANKLRNTISLPFTCLTWSLIEEMLNNKDILTEYLHRNEFKGSQMYLWHLLERQAHDIILSILPKGRTMLSEGYRDIEIPAVLMKVFMRYNKKNPTLKIDIPFIKDFAGKSPLHRALDDDDPMHNSANFFLKILRNMNLDHHGRAIYDILPLVLSSELS